MKMENLRLTEVRKSGTSPKHLGQDNISFEILDLGLFLVVNWRPGFLEGYGGEGSFLFFDH